MYFLGFFFRIRVWLLYFGLILWVGGLEFFVVFGRFIVWGSSSDLESFRKVRNGVWGIYSFGLGLGCLFS